MDCHFIGICLILVCLNQVFCDVNNKEYDPMHPVFHPKMGDRMKRALPDLKFETRDGEKTGKHWKTIAQNVLQEQLQKNNLNQKLAKNIIMFLGDGMSIATLTAARVYMGGEDKSLSFEKFPYTGLSKTYCTNTQVADSACTATAYLGGVKGNYGTIGVTGSVNVNDCHGENNTANHVSSIAKWAQTAGMSTGLITTTHVTHASPAGVFAHTSNRNWEHNQVLVDDGGDPLVCHDIAKQLIHGDVGKKLKVIMGGGRSMFLPTYVTDRDGEKGKRTDDHNLIEQWKNMHARSNKQYAYVESRDQLLNSSQNLEYLFGLFSSGHMPFNIDADKTEKPSLTEMVDKALDILEKDNKGYFLFVEGGRIDHGHHYTQAIRALDETVEFSKAIELAKRRTNIDDTLIVVTSDHSHTMTISGYSSRGNDILGINDSQFGEDKLPYATINYANGPGYKRHLDENGNRIDLNDINMREKEYEFPSTVPLDIETHGGDDVGVFASGPWAHLFTGNYEQHYIPHAMAYASCIGHGQTLCS